jgi:hypothetical protein
MTTQEKAAASRLAISLGRIVLYALTEADAEKINRRRTTGESIAHRLGVEKWPEGAQAHIGNRANALDLVPMTVVRVWNDNMVNGQATLDGTDSPGHAGNVALPAAGVIER